MSEVTMRPAISLHGTPPAAMVEARMNAREATRILMDALAETAPNARDYVGQTDVYKRDYAIYRVRLLFLDELYNSLGAEALDIQTRAA